MATASLLHLFLRKMVIDRDAPWLSRGLRLMTVLGAAILATYLVMGNKSSFNLATPYYLGSMSSNELEAGLESLALDMGLGYTDRLRANGPSLRQIKQYTEHYFFVRRAAKPSKDLMRIGPRITWAEAAKHPLCLLTRDMHNRTIVEKAFHEAGEACEPVIQTNAILTLALSVAEGNVCTVMPGALVGAVRGFRELEALPLVSPEVRTTIGFMAQGGDPSRTLEAALDLAQDASWLRHAAAHSGLLSV